MDVILDAKPDTAAQVNQVLVLRDFDLTTYAYGMNEEPARNFLKLVSAFEAPTPQFGYSSPEMTAGVDALRVASNPTELEAAYRKIAEVWTRDVPALVIAEIPEATIANKKVKGVAFVGSSNVSFANAWMTA
jgi:ABC-type oligopeptide transport system substrate-binding subunit